MKTNKFTIKARLLSFRFAGEGVFFFFRYEHNAWIHFVATVGVLIAGWFFQLAAIEWIAIIFAIGLVIVTEIINTSIEKIMDHLSPEKHPAVKVVKDLASAAVLVAALIALIVGLIIFIPKLA
ncbi:MAG: diacylglycerol kinase family protein [Chitinophagaceae bacterium]